MGLGGKATSLHRRATLLAGLGLAASSCTAAPGPPTTTTTRPAPATTTTTRPAPATTGPGPATARVRVFFLDEEHARTGEEPIFVPVTRLVRPPAVATGALDALFAGPTPAEQADGLRLVRSGATGFSSLHIDGGVARVRLEGGCASGGSTMTIAGEIVPTLRQFSSVAAVKILAPDGTTERPDGTIDSIPTCLEP